MKLARRLELLKPSATLAINATALELKAQGIKVTSLAVGEPDALPPPHVCEAAKRAIEDGMSKYTDVAGIAPLRKAAAAYYQRLYGISPSESQVIFGNGGKQDLYTLMLVLLNPGDEVLIPAPFWLSYPDMVRLAEGVPVSVLAGAQQGFKVNVEQLEAARTPKTRMLIFNSPSNPTGAVYSKEESDAIMEWAMRNDLFVISDEIYDQIVYAPAKPYSLASWWERYPEQVALVNGLSKTFAMTGWRIGYAIAHEAVIKAMAKLQGQMTSNICSIAQYAALAALEGPYDSVISMRNSLMARCESAWKEISTWEGVSCPKPDGAFYLFLDINALLTKEIPDAAAMCTHLLKKGNVAAVPGDVFGAPGCVRFSYALPEEELMNALSRVKQVFYS